jgi:hypothetical protein
VALLDYAWGNIEVLGNESFFLLPWRDGVKDHPVVRVMSGIAPLRVYRDADEREAILREEGADFLYAIKNGWNDDVFSQRVKTGIHAIFRESEFHGDVFAYVSQWLSQVMAYGKTPWVPHMIRLVDTQESLRPELGIPRDAIVFGRHGGDDSFDIPWVQKTVLRFAQKNPEVHFLFLNTRAFLSGNLPNIHHLPGTADAKKKRAFLNTANAMIHGRQRGETVGLACLEFASLGKTVLTYADSPEQGHLGVLGTACRTYRDQEDLTEALLAQSWDSHRADFSDFNPAAVMNRFQDVFLRPL